MQPFAPLCLTKPSLLSFLRKNVASLVEFNLTPFVSPLVLYMLSLKQMRTGNAFCTLRELGGRHSVPLRRPLISFLQGRTVVLNWMGDDALILMTLSIKLLRWTFPMPLLKRTACPFPLSTMPCGGRRPVAILSKESAPFAGMQSWSGLFWSAWIIPTLLIPLSMLQIVRCVGPFALPIRQQQTWFPFPNMAFLVRTLQPWVHLGSLDKTSALLVPTPLKGTLLQETLKGDVFVVAIVL